MNIINRIVQTITDWFGRKKNISKKEEVFLGLDPIIPNNDLNETEIPTEIVIGMGNESIVLNRINEIEMGSELSLMVNNDTNFFSQILAAGTLGGSVLFSVKGLYKATVTPEKLMRYADNSLSSITLKGNNFSSHAGFVNANVAVFTPILIFQFTSMVTGQYYFNGISRQLTLIQNRIEQILQLYHNERIATLRMITDKLVSWQNSKYFTIEDFVHIDIIKAQLATIRYEYLLAAEQQLKESLFPTKGKINTTLHEVKGISQIERLKKNTALLFGSIKKELKSIYTDSATESLMNHINRFMERSGKKAGALIDKVHQSKFMFFIEASLEADKLFQYAEFIELRANLAYKDPDQNRIGKINQLYDNLSDHNGTGHSIADEVLPIAKDLEKELFRVLSHHKQNSFVNQMEISQYTADLHLQFSRLEKYSTVNSDLRLERKKISGAFTKDVEFIVDNRDGNQKIYIKKI